MITRRRGLAIVLVVAGAGLLAVYGLRDDDGRANDARQQPKAVQHAEAPPEPALQGKQPSTAPGVASAPADHDHAHETEEEARERRPPVAVPAEPRHRRWPVSETPAGRAVAAHFGTFDAAGPSAQQRFDEALAELRRNLPESASELQKLYEQANEGDFQTRSMATNALRQLESHETTDALVNIATQPLPVITETGHNAPRMREEGMIRFAAIDGLGRLAVRGNSEALSALDQLMQTGQPEVRRYAAQQYVEANGYSRESKSYAASVLPVDDQPAVDAAPLHPEDRPMPEPEQPPPNPNKPDREKAPVEWPDAGPDHNE